MLVTVVAVVAAVVVPVSYLAAAAGSCGVAAAVAPAGSRAMMSLAAWVPVSFGVLVGLAPLA